YACTAFGPTLVPSRNGTGLHWAEVFSRRVQAVPAACIEPSDESALVDSLPKNSCPWVAPASPGRATGSSWSEWENRQMTRKLPLLMAAALGMASAMQSKLPTRTRRATIDFLDRATPAHTPPRGKRLLCKVQLARQSSKTSGSHVGDQLLHTLA